MQLDDVAVSLGFTCAFKVTVQDHVPARLEPVHFKEESKEKPKEKSEAVKIEEDDAMMKKMYSRMSEIDKARKDMDKEYAMIKNKLGAMMKKVKASSSESN